MQVFEMARRFPLEVLGFVLVDAFAVLFVHVQLKMREIGYKTHPYSRARPIGRFR
jgi:hypothetical protein